MVLDLINIPEEIAEDIKEDLAVLNDDKLEDLKGSPFAVEPKRKVAFKPPPPSEPADTVGAEAPAPKKKKKELSEKQKAHLARMRAKKANKAQAKVEKMIEKAPEVVNEVSAPKPQEITEEELEYMEAEEFNMWLKNMDKFERLIKKQQEIKRKKEEKMKKEEEAIEARVRAKLEKEYRQSQGIRQKIPEPESLNKQEDFGDYSSYFGY